MIISSHLTVKSFNLTGRPPASNMACVLDSSTWFNPSSALPAFTTNYTLGSFSEIQWWGNSVPDGKQRQYWKVVLAWASDMNVTNAESLCHKYGVQHEV